VNLLPILFWERIEGWAHGALVLYAGRRALRSAAAARRRTRRRKYALARIGDEAARWVERAFERRSTLLVPLGWWPWFKELRGHPKHRELTQRMKLPIVLDA
jgi:hypothetical protein